MNSILYTLGQIFIGIFIVLILISIILVENDRRILNEMSNDDLTHFDGPGYNGLVQPYVPLDEVKDEKVNQVIKEYNKKIKLFYFSFLFLIAAIIFFTNAA